MQRSRRGPALLATAAVCVMVCLIAGCSTHGAPRAAPKHTGTTTPGTTACEVQGYFDETDAGACPDGTCPVDAFDTNEGRLACCTSVVSGPGSCLGAEGGMFDAPFDSAMPDAGDASDASLD